MCAGFSDGDAFTIDLAPAEEPWRAESWLTQALNPVDFQAVIEGGQESVPVELWFGGTVLAACCGVAASLKLKVGQIFCEDWDAKRRQEL